MMSPGESLHSMEFRSTVRLRVYAKLALAMIFLLVPCPLALGQGITASMHGSILDVSQAVVPGATVIITHVDTGITRTLTTDKSGRYVATALPVGAYEVRVELSGFAVQVRTGIFLSVNDNPAIDLVLRPGDISEKVEVSASAPLVETSSPVISSLMDERQVAELPLNGRGFGQLVAIQPGVMSFPAGGGGMLNSNSIGGILIGAQATSIIAYGQRPEQNLYLLDGTEMNTQNKSMPVSGGGDMLGVETVREFKVLSQVDATYGQVSGAVVVAVTRSGTNEFHGSAFEFLRNSKLDSRNFFDSSSVPPFKRNQFGGALGGPVVRDKTFFFGDYEGFRERLASTRIAFVPNKAAHDGIVPGQPAINIPDNIRPFLALYPLPNGPDVGQGLGQYSFPGSFPRNQNQFMTRIDHQFSESDTLFGRYTYTDGDTSASLNLPIFPLTTENRYQYLTISETHVFSPGVLNQFTLSGSRTHFAAQGKTTFEPPAATFSNGNQFPYVSIGSTLTSVISGLSPLGASFPNLLAQSQNIFAFSDNVMIVKGRHTLTLGGEFKRYNANDNSPFGIPPNFVFGNLAGFLRGQAAAAFAGSGESNSFGHRQNVIALFVQDSFRLSDRFTVSLGLRNEIFTEPSEKYGRVSSYDFSKRSGLPVQGKLWGTLNGIAPRLGLAWDPTGSGKTSIRMGAGIYYNAVLPKDYWHIGLTNYPWWKAAILPAPPFPVIPSSRFDVPITSVLIQPMDSNLKAPTSIQYNFSIQRELLPQLALTLSYAGSNNYHGLKTIKANPRTPVGFSSPNQPIYAATQPRINPLLGEVDGFASDSNSNYNAMTVTLDRRFNAGFQLVGNYTWAKALSDFDLLTPNDQVTQSTVEINPFNRSQDHARARFDIRQKLDVNGVWELPFGRGRMFRNTASGLSQALIGGWQFSGILTARTGYPVTPIMTFGNSLDGQSYFIAERPDFVPGASGIPMPRRPELWFDPSVFKIPTAGRYGNVGRSVIEAPGLWGIDMSLMKRFDLTERHVLDFRWEVFNVLNHANFSAPNSNVLASNGTIPVTAARITTTATSSRQMQFSLRFKF